MNPEMPVAGRVAWWGTALLRGHIGPDEFTDGLGEEYVAHVVVGRGALSAALVASGGTAVAAVLPDAGDLTGLAGPAAFNTAAVDAGSAVVTIDAPLGLVPTEVGRALEWTGHRVNRRMPPDLGEADRALRTALLTATDELSRLDVAKWSPEIADELLALRDGVPVAAPPGTPTRAVELAGRALHLWTVTDLATVDDGAAVSASEAAARREAVRGLGRASRQALAAACAPDGWPPAPTDADR